MGSGLNTVRLIKISSIKSTYWTEKILRQTRYPNSIETWPLSVMSRLDPFLMLNRTVLRLDPFLCFFYKPNSIETWPLSVLLSVLCLTPFCALLLSVVAFCFVDVCIHRRWSGRVSVKFFDTILINASHSKLRGINCALQLAGFQPAFAPRWRKLKSQRLN